MTDIIDNELFNHLVELAALELTAEEGEYLRRELNNQLKAIHELAAIPLDNTIPPALHGISFTREISQGPRSDEWQPYPNPEEILSQAPEVEGGYILVPDIPHKQLD
jgi:aspartyl-tRNA(Asn)/glutamyl-tRNA(Gln) amidotransferase subunit C